jgi:hypothetical protein
LSIEGGQIPSIGGEEGLLVYPLGSKGVTTPSVPFSHIQSSAVSPPGFLNIDWRSGFADSNPSSLRGIARSSGAIWSGLVTIWPNWGFFAYPPEKVYSRHYPVVADGADGVSPR